MELIKLIILSTLVLWILFAIIFPIANWAKKQNKLIRSIVYIPVAGFLIVDVVYNAVIGTILFRELPTGRKVWFIETFSERIDEKWQSIFDKPGSFDYKLTKFFRKIILRVDPNHFD